MFNVLPDNFKERIKSEYRTRRAVIVLVFIIFMQISFLIFLLPSWVTSEFREKEIELQAEEINNLAVTSELNSFSSIIASTNVKLNILNTTLKYPMLTPVVNTIIQNKTRAVVLNQFSYSLTGTSTATLSIAGVSETREALVTFVKSLEKTKLFKTVDSPISNLAKDKNLDFSVNLVVAQ